MTEKPIQQNAEQETADSLNATAQAIRAEHAGRIEQLATEADTNNLSLHGLISAAHTQERQLQEAQLQALDSRQKELEATLQKANAFQQGEWLLREKEHLKQRMQIEELRENIEETLEKLPPSEKRDKMQQQLETLLEKALEKQRSMEEEERNIAKMQKEDFDRLDREIKENKEILLRQQEKKLVQEMGDIVEATANGQKQLQQEFKSIIEEDKAELDKLLQSAQSQFKAMKENLELEQKKHKEVIRVQMQSCQKLIQSGKAEDAYKLQLKVLGELKKRQEDLQKEHHLASQSMQHSLEQMEKLSESKAKKTEEKSAAFFEMVKEHMEKQEAVYVQHMERKLASSIKDDVAALEKRMAGRYKSNQKGYREMLEQMKAKMALQAQDRQRRCQEECVRFLTQTRARIHEVEKRFHTDQVNFKQETKLLYTVAGSGLRDMEMANLEMQRQLQMEQERTLNDEHKRTQELIKGVEEKLKAEQMRKKITIGKEFTQAQDFLDLETKIKARRAVESMAGVGRSALEYLRECQDDQQKLMMIEQKRMKELVKIMETRIREVEAAHEQRLRDAHREQEETQRKVEKKQQEISEELDRISEALRKTGENPAGLDASMPKEEYEREKREMMALLHKAKEKHEHNRTKQLTLLKEAKQKRDMAIQHSQVKVREDKQEVFRQHDEAVSSLHNHIEAKLQDLKQEQQQLLKQYEGKKEDILQNAEAAQRDLKEKRRLVQEETQRRLKALNQSAATNAADGMDAP